MSGADLKVNTAVLDSVGTSFGAAASGLAGIAADSPLADAASAVAQLKTAAACSKVQTQVADLTAALAAAAQTFGTNLGTAARDYDSRDTSSAEAISRAV